MSGTPFKTPLPYTPKSTHHLPQFFHTPAKTTSDSDTESSSSTTSESGTGTATAGGDLSIVAEFDDLMRFMKQRRNVELEDFILSLLEQSKETTSKWLLATKEIERLQQAVNQKIKECSDLESMLAKSRKLLDHEKRITREVERERDNFEMQIAHAREVLFKDHKNRVCLSEETRDKLAFLNTSIINGDMNNGQLSAIPEVNSTGSILSDFSYSRSEDDLDTSLLKTSKTWKKHKPFEGMAEPAYKKRRSSGNKVVELTSSETVRATTTLTVPKEGPITATSMIESVPQGAVKERKSRVDLLPETPSALPAHLVFDSWARGSPRLPERNNNNFRQHSFQQKNVIISETCAKCEKRIRFGKTYVRCKECKTICHPDCVDGVPLPCVPSVNTPNRNLQGVIGDFTPTIPPMVPAIVVHCVNEIENRGMKELGLYRVPGSERDVKALKDKFLKGRGAPCLTNIDIHVICGTIKDFLRSLSEPLITKALWRTFIKAAELKDARDVQSALTEAISQLPQPNRDTLAYIILHLKRISQSPECKMPVLNLAKIFGPTIVGYSSDELDPSCLLSETSQQAQVMMHLLEIPDDYWSSIVDVNNHMKRNGKLQQTPSTDSLLRTPTTGRFFPPISSASTKGKRKQKFFATPPYMKD